MIAAGAVVEQLTDGHLASMEWLAGGRDLALVMALADGRQLRVVCTDVTGLDVDLHYRKNAGGTPHAYACELERTLRGRWSLHWSFPPLGVIALECADLVVNGLADSAADADSGA